MPRRLNAILLSLALLVQSGPLCACTAGHMLLCHGPTDNPADAAEPVATPSDFCGDAGCGLTPNDCAHHHHRDACGRGKTPRAGERPGHAPGVPATAVFAPLALSAPAHARDVSRDVVADTSPGSRRSVPLLN